ncbi:MAG: hypothetical protein GY838_01865 [bacterium]|nr:hypothetical protein [bacterium]
MSLAFSQPLGGAWRRMQDLLFHPFDLGRWFVLGFAAWLAGLVESGGSGGGSLEYLFDMDDGRDFSDLPTRTWESVQDLMVEAWVVGLVVICLLGALVLGLVLLWIGSRGQFVLLDDLVHRRTEITRPWREFAAQGDSLFLWQVVYAVIAFVVMAGLTLSAVVGIGWLAALDFPAGASFPFFVLGGILAFVLVAILIYVEFFLIHAVVPIMYRRRCSTMEAWRVFGGVFRAHPGSFVLFGLLHLAVGMAGGFFFFAAGLLTCCVGLVLMMIPYLGSVVTLPLPVLLRYFDLEFMGQLGEDWRTLDPLPEPELPGPPSPAPAPVPDEQDSVEFERDGTVVGTEDVGEDPGGPEPRPEDP